MSHVEAITKNTVDFSHIEEVEAYKVFPEIFVQGEGVKLKRRANRHPECIPSDPDFIPDETTLRRVLAWWYAPMRQALGLYGETGTGKTELLLYVADRLNEPVYMVKVHPALMPEELEGSKELVNSGKGVITRNTLGLAAKAYRNGGLLILDEVDKASAPLGCALHGLVEGKPWPIEQFGIVLHRHKSCRVAATANTTGEGGHDRYHTSNRMDQALRSRFGWLKTHFPMQAHELKILEKKFPKIPYSMLKDCVKLANAFRDALLGPADNKGRRPGNVENPINCVFSTRTTVNWCSYTMAFGMNATWRESLDFAFSGSIDPESMPEANGIIQRVLDTSLDMPVSDVVRGYVIGGKL